MFDADGNEMVDKREFLVVRVTRLVKWLWLLIFYGSYSLSFHQLEEILGKKKDKKEVAEDVQQLDQQVWVASWCH